MRALFVLLALAALAVAPAAAQQKSSKSTPAKSSSSASAPTASAPLNINTATLAQLEALPGLGRAVAERIVEYRDKNGTFKKVEDLMNVKGIGEKSFLKLKPLITVTQKADPSGL
jgi:competence protein ComEA